MTVERWDEATWPRFESIDGGRAVAILPVGAIEAHGPHLPVGTDNLIALAMAEAAARRLDVHGFDTFVLPPITYTAAPFASGFAGTLSVRPETTTALIVDVGQAVASRGVETLALANAHFDPANIGAIRAAAGTLEAAGTLRVVFPDVTRRRWAERLTEEFQSGACHAGRYEGSMVLAVRPDLVDETARAELPAFRTSLSKAISSGARSFEELGGEQAYFGDPAAATAGEGRETIEALGAILEEAVLEAFEPAGS